MIKLVAHGSEDLRRLLSAHLAHLGVDVIVLEGPTACPTNFRCAIFPPCGRAWPDSNTSARAAWVGVPRYVDEVVTANPGHKARFRAGVKWLAGKKFMELDETQQIAILQPLSEALDGGRAKSDSERFFALMKSMTADGYYTSRTGLVQELGYQGNTVLGSFPECAHPEHHG